MKYNAKGIAYLIAVLGLFLMISTQAYSFGFSSEEADTVNLQTYIISDFGDVLDREDGIIWGIKFSDFAVPVDLSDDADTTDYNRRPNPDVCAGQYFEGQPNGIPEEREVEQIFCLGVKAQYIRNGFNWIEVIPVYVDDAIADSDVNTPLTPVTIYDETRTVETEYGEGTITNLNLNGVIDSLDLWVWGGNYNWWLEFYLEDYEGYLHTLEAGNIAYIGWKNLRTDVPGYIPQSEGYVPFLQNLKLIMLKLWSYPTERIDQFFVYFDYLQVQTDVYTERFNGDDLKESW